MSKKSELQGKQIRIAESMVRNSLNVKCSINGEKREVAISIFATMNALRAVAIALGAKFVADDECCVYTNDKIVLAASEAARINAAIEAARAAATAELQEDASWRKCDKLFEYMVPAVMA